MNDLLIINGRVIDPASGRDGIGNVYMQGGKIAAVGPDVTGPGDVIDAAGKIVCPGLIDLHVHCREPGH